uniref:G-protein coupled receptors family 2 profile 2 domain-containing protein n=1 Tax=Laticauda laticaudata TaxID=8630 RepID=A0A8C5RKW2_LATLA
MPTAPLARQGKSSPAPSPGILARSVLWLAAPLGSMPSLCRLIVVWVQFGFSSHFWALFCYSLEAALLLQNPTSHRSLTPYGLLCWGLPAVQVLLGLLLLTKHQDTNCSSHHGLAWILETVCYASSFVPLSLVFLGSPLLFYKALQAVPALLRRGRGMQAAGEWHQQQELRRRFSSVMVAFAACWLANVLHELLLLLLELEPLGKWGTGQLRGAALTCWAVMIILNPLSGALLILAFSSWKSRWCSRKQAPTWRPPVEISGGGLKENGPLPGRALEPAVGCWIEPGPLEVSSLLVSFESSTSLDFLCEGPGGCPIQPQSRHEQSCPEDSTPLPVSSCSCCKEGTCAGCTPPAWPAAPMPAGPASPTSPGVQASWPVQAGDGRLWKRPGPSWVGSRIPSDEEAL